MVLNVDVKIQSQILAVWIQRSSERKEAGTSWQDFHWLMWTGPLGVWVLPGRMMVPGASVRNPTHGKGHEEGSPTKREGVIWLQGFPLSFPEHLPPKTRVGLILLYYAFPLFWHSLKKVNLGLQSSAFERNVSAQTPFDGSLTCLTGCPGLFTTRELFTAPQLQEAQSLKHLKDTESFLKR